MEKVTSLVPQTDKPLTRMTETTLVDLLIVTGCMLPDEIAQHEAFTGNKFDAEDLAVQLHTSGGLKWTCRVIETNEPIFSCGFFQVNNGVWRSYMVCGEKTFTEYAAESTQHATNVATDVANISPFIRIETICLADRPHVRRWYEKIGLTFETELPNYGAQGENAVMYTKFGSAIKVPEPQLIARI